jgi:hypothetical protein
VNQLNGCLVNYSPLLNNSTIVIASTTGQQIAVKITPKIFSRVKGREWYRIAASIKPVSNKAISECHIKKEATRLLITIEI